MKNQKSKLVFLILLSVALALTACGTTETPNITRELQSESSTASDIPAASTDVPSSSNDRINETEETISNTNEVATELEEQLVVQSTPNDSNNYVQLEYWSIEEFENWIEQQYEENQRLADSHDKSFYDKDMNGDYYCRAWTQEDVDALYTEWQEQLELMKQGYQFTKSIPCSIDGAISGVFGPETNDPPVSALGSTIITLPDGSMVNLGYFDTADGAAQAVEQYLTQQVKAGVLTQGEADKILEHGAIE